MGKLHSKHGKLFFIPEREITDAPAAAARLSSNTIHCLLTFFLSSSQAAICKPRESPEGKLLSFSSPHDKLSHLGQFVESCSGLCEDGKHGAEETQSLITRFFVSGDSFVVNACLARKGIDDWLVKQKYYCTSSRLEQQDCHHRNNCGLSARVSSSPSTRFTGAAR